MDDLPLNLFDMLVIAVLVLSALIAFARGMVKELLKLLAWVGAAVATFYAFDYVRPIVRGVISIETIADGVAAIGIFLVILILLSVVANTVSDRIRKSNLSGLDRTLGFLFGIVRGGVVICLLYLLTTWVVKPERIPDWVLEARSQPYVSTGAEILAQLAPEKLRVETKAAAEKTRSRATKAIEAGKAVRDLSKQPGTGGGATAGGKSGSTSPGKKGYDPEQRKELDKLINQSQ